MRGSKRQTGTAIDAPRGKGSLVRQIKSVIEAPKGQGSLAQGLPWVFCFIASRPVRALECRKPGTVFLVPERCNSGAPTGRNATKNHTQGKPWAMFLCSFGAPIAAYLMLFRKALLGLFADQGSTQRQVLIPPTIPPTDKPLSLKRNV